MYSLKIKGLALLTAIISIHAMSAQFQVKLADLDHGSVRVEEAGHAFFDWKPDATTRSTFDKYGVPYAAKMRAFFDQVFY